MCCAQVMCKVAIVDIGIISHWNFFHMVTADVLLMPLFIDLKEMNTDKLNTITVKINDNLLHALKSNVQIM